MLIIANKVSAHSSPPTTAVATPLGGLRPRILYAAVALVALTIVLLCTPSYSAAASTTCNKFASPQGSNAGTGSATAPFLTAQALANSLSAGQVGCLKAGTYTGGLTFYHGGTDGSPIVLRSDPGEQAVITGRMWIAEGANYVTVADLSLDGNHQPNGETLPSPSVDANNVTFESDDVTDEHTGICFVLGSPSWGAAGSTVISGDHIHDCGVLPATNHDHGIYMEDATNTRIVGNFIDRNADRGIQLYPYATGSVITDNVIAENGTGIDISGAEGVASSNNTIEHNLIVNSLVRHDVESWFPEGNPLGTNNIVRNNCVSSAGIDTEGGGFTPTSNVTASAGEFHAEETGYSVKAGTACAAMVQNLPNIPSLTSPPVSKETPVPTKPVPTEPVSTEPGSAPSTGANPSSAETPAPTEETTTGTGSQKPLPTGSHHDHSHRYHKQVTRGINARTARVKAARRAKTAARKGRSSSSSR